MFRWHLLPDVQKVVIQDMPSSLERVLQFAAMTVLSVWREHFLLKKVGSFGEKRIENAIKIHSWFSGNITKNVLFQKASVFP